MLPLETDGQWQSRLMVDGLGLWLMDWADFHGLTGKPASPGNGSLWEKALGVPESFRTTAHVVDKLSLPKAMQSPKVVETAGNGKDCGTFC